MQGVFAKFSVVGAPSAREPNGYEGYQSCLAWNADRDSYGSVENPTLTETLMAALDESLGEGPEVHSVHASVEESKPSIVLQSGYAPPVEFSLSRLGLSLPPAGLSLSPVDSTSVEVSHSSGDFPERAVGFDPTAKQSIEVSGELPDVIGFSFGGTPVQDGAYMDLSSEPATTGFVSTMLGWFGHSHPSTEEGSTPS
jgi:hypothetical protein